MEARELSKFTKDDLSNLKAFKTVISKADYPLKGDAIRMVASLFNWLDGLELKIEDAIKKDKLDGILKVGSIE